MFLDHTQRRTTVGRTPLEERSARRRDLYLTTYDTHNRQISMPPVGFEPTISAGERPHSGARNMYRIGINIYENRAVRQVGYLQEREMRVLTTRQKTQLHFRPVWFFKTGMHRLLVINIYLMLFIPFMLLHPINQEKQFTS